MTSTKKTETEKKELKRAKSLFKSNQSTEPGKKLRDEIISTILGYSKNLPNWGSLNFKIA